MCLTWFSDMKIRVIPNDEYPDSGVMVLEGHMRAVDFDGVNLKAARALLRKYKRMKE